MIRINEVKFDIKEPFGKPQIISKILKKTGLKSDQLIDFQIVRESIDARKGLNFSYVIDIRTTKESFLLKKGFKEAPKPFEPIHLRRHIEATSANQHRPIVVGMGPAGLFAALQLAYAGLNPVVLEMGEPVEHRKITVDRFWKEGHLNPKSNVQFGEGGAGAFSDGKLTTRIKDPRIEFVIDELIKAGAPEEIRYQNKPHIGTDLLCDVVKQLRLKIISLGGEVHFNSEVVALKVDNDHVEIIVENGLTYQTNAMILAIGHSARGLFEVLEQMGMAMEQKPFAMGVRIEHPQVLIDAVQYGEDRKSSRLGAAEYKLTHGTSNGRSVYSFCMCPGGKVVGSASEEGHLVVNGMSYHARDLENANSALLVNIMPEDFPSKEVLAGVTYQRTLERKAFLAGGGGYKAPTQKLSDFMAEKQCFDKDAVVAYYKQFDIDYEKVMSRYNITYEPETVETDLTTVLPAFMKEALVEAIVRFGRIIPGFDDPRIKITAVESRSSSPVRIIRNPEQYHSISHEMIYPCGEGAGYAGGITSSAVDGVKVAEAIIMKKKVQIV